MPVGNNSQAIAAQAEYLRPNLEMLAMMQSVLWKEIGVRTDVKAVSTRPSRIPFQPATGNLFKQNGLDGQDMGLGSSFPEVPGYLSCVPFIQATQYTALAEYATDSDEKSIANYVTETNRQATETFAGYMDALAANSDGSNTLDTVVSTATDEIIVNNADIFQDNQNIDIWTALGGTLRGTVQIQSIDIANNALATTGPLPAGTTAGDLLLVNGSAGTSNSGWMGLPAYQVSGNTGTYMTISRSAWPGKFSTPSINLGGKSLTPAVIRALEMKMIYAMGDDNDGVDNVAHCGPDMQAAWENNALLVQKVIMNEMRGDESEDMLKRRPPSTIGDRRILRNVRAIPNRIDFLNLKHWFRIETKATDFYEVGGQTVFPAYGISGGLASSMLFYLVYMGQMGNGQPRRGGFVSNVAPPANILS